MAIPQQPDLFPEIPIVGSLPPVSGTTKLARVASRSGAEAVKATWGAKQRKMLLWLSRGPMSRQQLSDATGITINAVCSCLDRLKKAGVVESNGDVEFVQLPGMRPSQRERFRLTR